MHLEEPTATGLMYSDTDGDGPVVVVLHRVLMNGTLWDEVVGGLRDRYGVPPRTLNITPVTLALEKGPDRTASLCSKLIEAHVRSACRPPQTHP